MARILVLNDDQTMLDVYEAALTELGHDPVTKEVLASGPDTVREVAADALVVDLQRPEDDHYGLRIIEEIRAEPELRALPIILCTGAADELVEVQPRLESWRVPVLRKPFRVEELNTALETMIHKDRPAG